MLYFQSLFIYSTGNTRNLLKEKMPKTIEISPKLCQIFGELGINYMICLRKSEYQIRLIFLYINMFVCCCFLNVYFNTETY